MSYIPKLKAGTTVEGTTPKGLKGSGRILAVEGATYVIDMDWGHGRKGVVYENAEMIDGYFREVEGNEKKTASVYYDRNGFKMRPYFTTIRLSKTEGILVSNKFLRSHLHALEFEHLQTDSQFVGWVKKEFETEKAILLSGGLYKIWVPKALIEDASPRNRKA